MKCTHCEGTGLISSYEVCGACQGLGHVGEKPEEAVEAPVEDVEKPRARKKK